MSMKLKTDAVLDVKCYSPKGSLDKRLYRKGTVFQGAKRTDLGCFIAFLANGISIHSEFSETCEIYIPLDLLENYNDEINETQEVG